LPLHLFDQLSAGGIAIWFIGALSVVSIAVTFERLQALRRAAIAPAGLVDEIVPLWQAGRLEEAERLLAGRAGALAQTLRFVLAHRARWPAETLAARAGDTASRLLRAQAQRAYPLAVVATLAPIVGLLGTVIGMIEAFHVIAFTGGMGDASLLAGGISKALVNTAAGLGVALPSLALHHFFRHRLVAGTLALEEQLERVLDACVRAGGR
jgi:biopolymer transport protein ExbB